jgi:hypothetical protein
MDSDPTFGTDPALIKSPKGLAFTPRSEAELTHVIEEVFDYRGDVTLQLKSGERVEGYVFNRNADATGAYLQIMPQDRSIRRTIPYAEISEVNFSGEDTASGKEWQDWSKKKESERQAEAAKIEAAARARGHL